MNVLVQLGTYSWWIVAFKLQSIKNDCTILHGNPSQTKNVKLIAVHEGKKVSGSPKSLGNNSMVIHPIVDHQTDLLLTWLKMVKQLKTLQSCFTCSSVNVTVLNNAFPKCSCALPVDPSFTLYSTPKTSTCLISYQNIPGVWISAECV